MQFLIKTHLSIKEYTAYRKMPNKVIKAYKSINNDRKNDNLM